MSFCNVGELTFHPVYNEEYSVANLHIVSGCGFHKSSPTSKVQGEMEQESWDFRPPATLVV